MQQKIVNYKIDIWALGIVILEVLNGGKAPYEDEGLEEEEVNTLNRSTYKSIKTIYIYRSNKGSFKSKGRFIPPIYPLS